MPIQFEGFSIAQRQSLIAAVMVLKSSAAQAKNALLSGNLNAFQTWFDSTGKNAHLMKVATTVKEIHGAIEKRKITFANATNNAVHHRDQHLCGYVYLNRISDGAHHPLRPDAHFGSGMRILLVPKTHDGDIDDLAETMYHELSHKVGGTDDLTYDEDVCRDYATNNQQNAALNAENYNLFLREFL